MEKVIVAPIMAESAGECAKLIRKLRWIGLEDEAHSGCKTR
jgi:hypothetical protein